MEYQALIYEAVQRLEEKVDNIAQRVTKLEVQLDHVAKCNEQFEATVRSQLVRIDTELNDLQTWKWKTIGFLAAASLFFTVLMKYVVPLVPIIS